MQPNRNCSYAVGWARTSNASSCAHYQMENAFSARWYQAIILDHGSSKFFAKTISKWTENVVQQDFFLISGRNSNRSRFRWSICSTLTAHYINSLKYLRMRPKNVMRWVRYFKWYNTMIRIYTQREKLRDISHVLLGFVSNTRCESFYWTASIYCMV